MLLQNVLNRQSSRLATISTIVNQTDTQQTSGLNQTWTLPVLGGLSLTSPPLQNANLGVVPVNVNLNSQAAVPVSTNTSWWWQSPAAQTLNANVRPTYITSQQGSNPPGLTFLPLVTATAPTIMDSGSSLYGSSNPFTFATPTRQDATYSNFGTGSNIADSAPINYFDSSRQILFNGKFPASFMLLTMKN